jgi:DNA-binding MarR family transcriptional regulator
MDACTQGRSGREIAQATGPASYALAMAAKAGRAALTHGLARLGLHPGQELIAVDLHEHAGSTQAELVDRIGIEQPTIARAIDRMQRRGFVLRKRDAADRRRISLSLTEKGEAVVDRVLATWSELDEVSTAGMTSTERETLIDLLTRVQGNLAGES